MTEGPHKHDGGHTLQVEQDEHAGGASVPGHGRRRRQEGRQGEEGRRPADDLVRPPRAADQADEHAEGDESPLRALHHPQRDEDGRRAGPPPRHAPAALQRRARGHPHLPQGLPQPHDLRRVQAALQHSGAQRRAQGLLRRHQGDQRHSQGHRSERGAVQDGHN